MRKLIFLTIMILFSCCSKNNDDEEIINTPTQQDKYYVKYSVNGCPYHKHFAQYRNVSGQLIDVTTHNSEEQFFEVGPVSPIFQAYIQCDYCVYIGPSINIYVKKNDQDYIKVASQSIRSNYNPGWITLTYNLREYD